MVSPWTALTFSIYRRKMWYNLDFIFLNLLHVTSSTALLQIVTEKQSFWSWLRPLFPGQSREGNIDVKQSLNRSEQALKVPRSWGSQISRQLAYEGGNVSPTHRPPLPPRKYSYYSFLLEAEWTQGPWSGRAKETYTVKNVSITVTKFTTCYFVL